MEPEAFIKIIDQTPLVSIDIILKDQEDRILLGYRTNRPAQGFWFVPGGRIRKNESLEQAMSRISLAELGYVISINECRIIGAFDHIYQDNFQNTPDINTHYVALGHEARLPEGQEISCDDQHSEFQWRCIEELLKADDVHLNTKRYFL